MEYKHIIRPHHGMCIAFFKGKGYSNEFTAHMAEMIKELQDATVCISKQTDVICEKCPNNVIGKCKTEDKVMGYDNKILEYCGLSNGEIIKYKEFYDLVNKKIIMTGKRENVCGDCQWNELCFVKE